MEVDGEPKAHMLLDAFELETLIHNLSMVRLELADGVTPALEAGMRLHIVIDPVWRTEASLSPSGAVLALRHPGHGWVGFVHPPHEARALGQTLVAIADELEGKSEKNGS